MGILKTIFIIVIIYYVWKLLFRLFFPAVAKKVMNKAQQTMNDRMRQAHEAQQGYAGQEGDVTVQKGAEKNSGVSDDEGDYVDFEEVKD